MRTVDRIFTLTAALIIASGFPRLGQAQVPTRESVPRLAVPASEPVAQAPGQSTASPATPAPAPAAPAPPAPDPLTPLTGPAGGVTTLPGTSQPTSSSAQAATAKVRSYAASKFYLELGLASGTTGTYVHSVAGGDLVGDVVMGPDLGPGSAVPMHVANVRVTDIVAEVAPNDFTDLIRPWLDGKITPVPGRLVGMNSTYQAQTQVGFRDAVLTEVAFPALDASSKEPGYLKLRLSPGSSGDEEASSVATKSAAGSKQQLWLRGNFSLTVAGLETKRVSRLEPFSIGMNLAPDAIGTVREPTNHPTKWVGTRLTVTFPAADVAGWMAWRDDFLIKGVGDAGEKSLVLTLLAGDLKTALLELDGSGVGLISLRRVAASGDVIPTYQADLYVEQWSVGKSASKGS